MGKVAIIAGGPSNERDISLRSGRAVYEALRLEGLDAELVELDGRDAENQLKRRRPDIAFIALHGRFGEDGTVQKILEAMGIPYTGSGANASRLALDKIASRKIFEENNIPVPDYKILNKPSREALGSLSLPVVVKPQNEGSSIGLSMARNEDEFDNACRNAFMFSPSIIVEKFIKAREITVGILEETALPVVEIIPENVFYDFDAKYKNKKTEYRVPAELPEGLAEKAQALALAAHQSLGCSDFSRVDMLLSPDGAIYVLEVNSIPGLTERSLMPKAAEAAGISFGKLCVKLLRLATENKGKKK
ncbi:MAG: D-alanine--D-alanine ligase [Candidatus Omnitrophica bacterium]|nr:D-alanine--D-alanine ligase [Candidatus Omnitrophota bacterium]